MKKEITISEKIRGTSTTAFIDDENKRKFLEKINGEKVEVIGYEITPDAFWTILNALAADKADFENREFSPALRVEERLHRPSQYYIMDK